MERESFEDLEVAAKLNKDFISIKVDREERPDIDHTYMMFCQALTGAGGWPLTVIMTADKKPFFAGTYFSKHSEGGRPGLLNVLNYLAQTWEVEKDKVLSSAEEIFSAVSGLHGNEENKLKVLKQKQEEVIGINMQEQADDIMSWGKGVIDKGLEMLVKTYDQRFGGFGKAPKFPSAHNLGFLMRYHLDRSDMNSSVIIKKTMDIMADGGIYDQIGYGFSRYSTDRFWLVPHFEKMLYDNATLAYAYLEAYQMTHEQRYADIAKEIFSYVLRDMLSPEGGFYSAEDADSEGEEGKFYVWTYQEATEVLTAEISRIKENKPGKGAEAQFRDVFLRYFSDPLTFANIFCEAYNITKEGNFEEKNILNRLFSDWHKLAQKNDIVFDDFMQLIQYCGAILLKAREKRVRPGKDDKILVSWNGLMIAALAKGAQVFSYQERNSEANQDYSAYLAQAEKAADFIYNNMRTSQGRLLARYRLGEAEYPAYLDDYVFYIFGLLELYFACGKTIYLQRALALQEEQEALFKDEVKGGYFFTGIDGEELLFRPKEIYDGALPSGNSLSILNLSRLWKLSGDSKWKRRASEHIQSFRQTIEAYPAGHLAFLSGIQHFLSQGEELILSGSLNNSVLFEMREEFFKDFRPYAVLLYNEGTLQEVNPEIKNYPLSEQTTAYLCRNFSCLKPVFSAEELKAVLRSIRNE